MKFTIQNPPILAKDILDKFGWQKITSLTVILILKRQIDEFK